VIVAGIGSPRAGAADGRKPAEADAFDWLWLEGGIGYQWFDLATISADPYQFSAAVIPTSAGGPAPSVGIGLRVSFLTLGVRATAAHLVHRTALMPDDDRWLWTLNGELGLRAPRFGRFQPYVRLGTGYTTFGGADQLGGVSAGLDIDGFNVQASAGCDYFFSSRWSIGLRGGVAALVLSRGGTPVRELMGSAEPITNLGDAAARMFDANGTSWGAGLEISSVIAWHF
jgi:hypothetical protein